MSREAKIVYSDNFFSTQEKINHYEGFGWELLSINGKQISLTRETQNPIYTELVKNEAKYNELVKEYELISNELNRVYHKPASIKAALILLLLAIIPGVLYIVFKTKDKNAKEALKIELRQKLDVKRKEIDDLVLLSRATFFGKQN